MLRALKIHCCILQDEEDIPTNMFSITAAKMLSNGINETNYKSLFQQITGLSMDGNDQELTIPQTRVSFGGIGMRTRGNVFCLFGIFGHFKCSRLFT